MKTKVMGDLKNLGGKVLGYFGMDIKATRFNWFRDCSEWKPFHHDAAAVKPDKAKT